MSLIQLRADREAALVNTKLAAVSEAFEGHEQAIDLFDRAIDIVKEAGVESPSETIDIAAEMVCTVLGIGADEPDTKEAAAADDASDEALAEARELGEAAALIAFRAGVTSEDVEKLAEDESVRFGRALGAAYRKLSADK